ncbi:coproporphyrinogen-III oxidase family protein [Salisaeta longa]|uniref:coproporphyrinogen-III oxidase family protein n=1 Tax=Salisaeta longa TaxID=503170 RepID=UPI0003B3F7A1|nr:coproporphyrinogen-III oxidase family protein [Salisaeta longa]
MAGLYIHVPFCRTRAPYDESYQVPTDATAFDAYVEAVTRELEIYAARYHDEAPVKSLYVGGARASLLPVPAMRALVTTVLDVFDASLIQEATLEVHPADASLDYLQAVHGLGFDRVSLSVLSFFADDLAALQAEHSAAQAQDAVHHAEQAGFETLSVDLLFGWREQSSDYWKGNLNHVRRMHVPHVALIEWNPEPEDDPVRHGKRLSYAMRFLDDEGYAPYELTHFARDGHRSLHQENYYAHGSYLGVGPSAHSFWWPAQTDEQPARRWANVQDVDEYCRLLGEPYAPISFREVVPRTARAEEYMLLRLRTLEGLDLRVLRERYGVDLQATHPHLLDQLVAGDLIEPLDPSAPCVRLTPDGRLVADGIAERLLRGVTASVEA